MTHNYTAANKVIQQRGFAHGSYQDYPPSDQAAGGIQQQNKQYVNPAGSISSEPAFNQSQSVPPQQAAGNNMQANNSCMYTQSVYSTGNNQLPVQPMQSRVQQVTPLSHLIPYNTQMGMLNGYGEDAFSLAIQLLKLGTQQQQLQQQPLNLQQNMIRNFQMQQQQQQHQPHQQQQQQQQGQFNNTGKQY